PLTGEDDPKPASAPPAAAQPTGPAAAGRVLFARMGCGNCHRLAAANARGEIGPDLDQRLPAHDRASLTAKIVDPYPDLPPDTFAVMPQDFGERMSPTELEALVAFLLSAPRN
ncbi:MAG: c-type cytochrome, partial [Solirubrobacteraceae bacterium]